MVHQKNASDLSVVSCGRFNDGISNLRSYRYWVVFHIWRRLIVVEVQRGDVEDCENKDG